MKDRQPWHKRPGTQGIANAARRQNLFEYSDISDRFASCCDLKCEVVGDHSANIEKGGCYKCARMAD